MSDKDTQSEPDPKPTLWQRPAVRGVVNGVVFAGLLMWMQVEGWFQEPRPLTDDSIVQNVVAGAVFGYALYILELWKRRRRVTAASATREAVQKRLAKQQTAGDQTEGESDDRRT